MAAGTWTRRQIGGSITRSAILSWYTTSWPGGTCSLVAATNHFLCPADHRFGCGHCPPVLVLADGLVRIHGLVGDGIAGGGRVVGEIARLPHALGHLMAGLAEQNQQLRDLVRPGELETVKDQDGLHRLLGRLLCVKTEIFPEALRRLRLPGSSQITPGTRQPGAS